MRVRSRPFLQLAALAVLGSVTGGCSEPPASTAMVVDSASIVSEVESAVWAFHAADTARDAAGVIALLWPEYSMWADGARVEYADVVSGSPAFMSTLDVFHTEWTDVRIRPLGPNAALASFHFRDSLVAKDGSVTRAQGPNTFIWERRDGEWRVIFGDADHYPIDEHMIP